MPRTGKLPLFPGARAYATLATMQGSEPDSDPHEADAQMPNRPDSAPAARTFLARLLDGWGVPEEMIDDAALLTGELMANAVQHGSGVVTLKIEANNGRLHVGVHDDEEALAEADRTGTSDLGGSGLWIVESMARDWGTDMSDEDTGKTVWFELKNLRGPTGQNDGDA
jgi:anti-sigma regulatory factor (Ser/Thr protein kinase)